MLTMVAAHWPTVAGAQTIGTFYWQLQPYCNTVALTVIQDAAGIRLQGTEDLCDPANPPQPVEGSAVLGSDGFANIGLTTTIAGQASFTGTRIYARINVTTLNGMWRDSAGRTGQLISVGAPSTPGTPMQQRGGHGTTFLHEVLEGINRPIPAAQNVTCFSHPLTDGNPDALILFSVNRGPQSNIRPAVPSTISLYYDNNGTPLPAPLDNNVWCLSRDDNAMMPDGAGFTIMVAPR
jgi:hypothetical protein